ncbi:MAG: endolytic transglycosylase MltG [Corynebacterium sp.]|uniref:endolytic transglycosylase MltG n=1 Tax=Corynebacterium sp. TaxID=1720 RepID=UPI0026DD91E4|nr:endolytic transglycosylase MltG [Corynebacterium sp.]MDO4760337.1 endolytic transglycosylase MltG [Corynebacterium sp.]
MRMEPKYVKRRQRAAAVLIAALVLLIGAVVYIGVSIVNRPPTDYVGQGNGVIQLVTIEEGSSISEIGPELAERGIVATNQAFQTAALSNPRAASIQPGVYRLQEMMSADSAVAALLDPNNQVEMLDIPGGSTLMDVTVVAGSTRPGIYSQISQVTCSAGSTNCIKPETLHNVGATAKLSDLGVPQWAQDKVSARGNDPRRLEGLIAPGKYVVNPNHDARQILSDLISRSAKQFESTGIQQRAQAVGMSPYELLIAASLVEREAPAGDFDKVARVILNRLAKPMRLEFDSTVNYGLSDVEVATTDEDRARETPWNTYAKDGLPETPIAAASLPALEAMENPAEGDWLFFVTTHTDGTTVFTNTFEEHLDAVQQSLANGVLNSNR